MPDATDSGVFERFRQGDRQAAGMLLDRLRPYLRVIVRTTQTDWTTTAPNESDLIQDVMLQAIKAAETFRGNSLGELVRWVRMMAIRISRRTLVRESVREPALRDKEIELDIADDGKFAPAELAIQQENSARMADALNRLPEEMRNVLIFRLVEGLEHNEIADRMKRSSGATRMLFLRAVERLRVVYGSDDDEWSTN